MTLLLVVLVVSAVVLWPHGRPSPGWGRSTLRRTAVGPTGAHPGADVPSGEDPGALVMAGVRALLTREVTFRRARRGWVADFAELAAVGLDAGLPSAEAARLACAVGRTSGHVGVDALATRLAAVEAHGGGVGDCLAEAAGGDRDLTFLAAAWQLTDEFGVAAAPAARTAAEVLRERAAGDDRRSVLAAGPRASMWLLTVLPLSGPLVAVLLGLPVAEVYGSGPAMVAAGVGLTLTCVGWLWSRTLLRRALRPAEVA